MHVQRLRCLSKGGSHNINTLRDNNTVADLCNHIYKITGIMAQDQKSMFILIHFKTKSIKYFNILIGYFYQNECCATQSWVTVLYGYPREQLDLSRPEQLLKTLPISSGDRIYIEFQQNTTPPRNENSTDQSKKPPSYSQSIGISDAKEDQCNLQKSEIPLWIFQRRQVPADNSCLFSSISYLLTSNLQTVEELRSLISEVVQRYPKLYTEAFLGVEPSEYSRWIMLSTSWGGGIEIAILSEHFQVEICVVDTVNIRIDRFGEDKNYQHRIFLIYDGSHYDSLELVDMANPNTSAKQKFSTNDDNLIPLALELANEVKLNRQNTYAGNYALRCSYCYKQLTGVYDAQQHTKLTGHTNFEEYE
ncbi:Ubiquitin thioesterase OTU1 [Trichoplax sp. H2]|nr:Ubiquitin thioesterase OTU1 [Trichoplax sp. H2]|eukprot:RDD40809.1 Ubiquitin thioesterase OTU1 [Trichoplax sp. H2]